MVYVTDLNGIMLDVNEAGARMLGYESREDVLGLKAAQAIYVKPQERKRFQEIVDRAGSVQDVETSFQRRDGTIIDVMITSTVRRNRKGDVEGYEGFVIDVTDRKRTERALQESEEKYRTVVENSLSAIFIHQGGVL